MSVSGSKAIHSCFTIILLLFSGAAMHLYGQERASQKPYILEIDGACYPHELSVEYFIRGKFGGYSSFIKTDSRFIRYEIPTVRDGIPATSMKLMIRGARCRTQIIDLPELERGGKMIRTRLRRARMVEFRGRIASPVVLSKQDAVLTVEYWAHWKCEFMGVPDCMIGPNRIDAIEMRSDGRFKVRLPDLASDLALSLFSNKGAFQFFIRDRKTGNVLYNLSKAGGERDIPVAAEYTQDTEFVAEPNPNREVGR